MAQSKWKCTKCRFTNDASRNKCIFCQTAAPHPTESSVHAATASSSKCITASPAVTTPTPAPPAALFWTCVYCARKLKNMKLKKCIRCGNKRIFEEKRKEKEKTEKKEQKVKPEEEKEKATEGKTWSCSVCTYIQTTSSTSCSMCNANKPSPLSPSTAIVSSLSVPATVPVTAPPAPATATVPTTAPPASSSSSSQWSCQSCTYLNSAHKNTCEMCFRPRATSLGALVPGIVSASSACDASLPSQTQHASASVPGPTPATARSGTLLETAPTPSTLTPSATRASFRMAVWFVDQIMLEGFQLRGRLAHEGAGDDHDTERDVCMTPDTESGKRGRETSQSASQRSKRSRVHSSSSASCSRSLSSSSLPTSRHTGAKLCVDSGSYISLDCSEESLLRCTGESNTLVYTSTYTVKQPGPKHRSCVADSTDHGVSESSSRDEQSPWCEQQEQSQMRDTLLASSSSEILLAMTEMCGVLILHGKLVHDHSQIAMVQVPLASLFLPSQLSALSAIDATSSLSRTASTTPATPAAKIFSSASCVADAVNAIVSEPSSQLRKLPLLLRSQV